MVVNEDENYYCTIEYCFPMPGCTDYYYKTETEALGTFGDAPSVKAFLNAVPNPANGTVAVNYAMAGKGPVTLRLLDLNGREVMATVADKNPGTVQWDVADLPGGVYLLYGLQDGNITGAQRLVIMR